MTEVFEGGCQCGNISYRVEGESVNLFVCHCTECQKQTSSAFGMALWISNYEIKSLTGQLQSWTRLAPSGQEIMGRFCGSCGTRVFHEISSNQNIISIKPGTLNNTNQLRPVAHIWTKSAQPWITIPGDCLAYPENPPGYDEIIAAWHEAK